MSNLTQPVTERHSDTEVQSLCVCCGGSLSWLMPYRFKSDAFRQAYRGSGIFLCAKCGLKQVDATQVNVPALTTYYAEGPYRQGAGIAGCSEQNLKRYRARAQAIAALATRHGPAHPTSVFEVGAGYGFNLLEFQRLYPEASFATDEIDTTVELPAGIRRQPLSDASADIMIMSHVLEHFSDPLALLRQALTALKPGGVVIIEVPNDETPELNIQAHHEPHLTFFDSRSMVGLLDHAGASVVELLTAGPKSKAFLDQKQALRAQVRAAVKDLPVIKHMLERRRAHLTLDFSTAVEHGTFLRVAARAL